MAIGKAEPMFLIKKFSYALSSIAASTTKTITIANLNYSIPTGYKPFGILNLSTGSAYCTTRAILLDPDMSDTSNGMLYIKNQDTSAKSNLTLRVEVVFINEKFMESQ